MCNSLDGNTARQVIALPMTDDHYLRGSAFAGIPGEEGVQRDTRHLQELAVVIRIADKQLRVPALPKQRPVHGTGSVGVQAGLCACKRDAGCRRREHIDKTTAMEPETEI